MNVPASSAAPAENNAVDTDARSAVDERTWSNLITALLGGVSLSAADTEWAMNEIMSGSATDAQVAGFAIALRAKGEGVSEVTGLAQGMLDNAVRIEVPGPTLDIVGTGGDRAHTVNVSTMAAIFLPVLVVFLFLLLLWGGFVLWRRGRARRQRRDQLMADAGYE